MPSKQSRNKNLIFWGVTLCLTLMVIFGLGEVLVRLQKQRIRTSDRMDPGLMQYHPRLGWKLTPNWQGTHKHHDFEVRYTTDGHGFRTDPVARKGKDGLQIAFVGDSFTFGLGVHDDETFVHYLQELSGGALVCRNYAVPGYSTDQEYLLVRERLLHLEPDVMVLVSYLGNDLFDNELPFPLQAQRAKPYFEMTSAGLTLRNVPVPLQSKSEAGQESDLAQIVFANSGGFLANLLNRLELLRLFEMHGVRLFERELDLDDGRFDSAVNLYGEIVQEMRQVCRERGVALVVVLLPGQSYVHRPWSVSARVQAFLRQEVINRMHALQIEVIDLATRLKQGHPSRREDWFYPNEGHLTPAGHRVVASMLVESLTMLPQGFRVQYR